MISSKLKEPDKRATMTGSHTLLILRVAILRHAASQVIDQTAGLADALRVNVAASRRRDGVANTSFLSARVRLVARSVL